MAVNFTIGDLTNDQSAGTQTPLTTDTGNDVNLTLNGSNIDGFGATTGVVDPGFETFLAGLGLSSAQVNFAVNVDGAASDDNTFIQAASDSGEKISDLFFKELDNPITHDNQISGMQTLAGENLYLHIDASGNYATVTTASGTGGRIVAAFGLFGETIAADQLSAQAGVQMVTFEAIKHPDATNPDDTLDFTDVLQIGAASTLSFNFDQLKSGNFLWAAVGDGSAAMLITGQDLNVNDKAGAHFGDIVNSGSTDPSDSVNTSQAAAGSEATIGINSQHFAPTNSGDGPTGVLTFVTGYQPLMQATPNYADINVSQIQYADYINVSGAAINISQLTGGSTSKIHIALFEAGGAGADQAPENLIPEEGYADVAGVSQSYIGNQDSDSHLTDDTAVDVATVTIGANTWNYNDANITTGVTKGVITVSIVGNDITVIGANAGDTIGFTARDTASTVDGTFNRIDIQALAGSAAFDIGHIDLTQGASTSEGLGSHLFADDSGPTIGNSDGVAAHAIQEGLVDFVKNSSVNYSLKGDVGTDPKTSPYTLVDWTSSVTVNGIAMHAVPDLDTGTTSVIYYADTNKSGTFGDTGDVGYFQLSLDQTANSGAGSYTFTVLNDPPASITHFGFADMPSGNNLFGIIGVNKANIVNNVLPDGGLLVIGDHVPALNADGTYITSGPNATETINTSKGGGQVTIGANNQMLDPGEGVYFVYVDDPAKSAVGGIKSGGLTQTTADDADTIKFNGTNTATTANAEIVQVQGNAGAAMEITAFDINPGTVNTLSGSESFAKAPTSTGSEVDITAIRVMNTLTGAVLESVTNDHTLNGVVGTDDANIAVTWHQDGTGHWYADVTGLGAGQTVEWDTAAAHDAVHIADIGGKFDIGGFSLIQHNDAADLFFDFTAQATDGDGDTAQACWEVGVDGTGANDNGAVSGIESGQPSDCVLSTSLLTTLALQPHENILGV